MNMDEKAEKIEEVIRFAIAIGYVKEETGAKLKENPDDVASIAKMIADATHEDEEKE